MANARRIELLAIMVNDGKDTPENSVSVMNAGERTNCIKVSVFHSKGGINYGTYAREPAGYWAALTPAYRKVENGWQSDSHMMFSGYKFYLGEGERFSAKTLQAYVNTLQHNEQYKATLNKLCTEGGLTIVENMKKAS